MKRMLLSALLLCSAPALADGPVTLAVDPAKSTLSYKVVHKFHEVEGKTSKVIALELGISPRTVEVYRANMMMKTEARSLSELVRMALLAGL